MGTSKRIKPWRNKLGESTADIFSVVIIMLFPAYRRHSAQKQSGLYILTHRGSACDLTSTVSASYVRNTYQLAFPVRRRGTASSQQTTELTFVSIS